MLNRFDEQSKIILFFTIDTVIKQTMKKWSEQYMQWIVDHRRKLIQKMREYREWTRACEKLNIYLFYWFFKQVRMITQWRTRKFAWRRQGHFDSQLCCIFTSCYWIHNMKIWKNVMHCLRRKNDDYIGHNPLYLTRIHLQ